MKGYSFRSLTDLVLKLFKTKINAGTGLSGGGSLEADRTLTVEYGTAAGTAAQGNDNRLSNSREWTGATISQAEAEAGIETTRRAFTAQRVRQAIVAWWNSVTGVFGRDLVTSADNIDARSKLGLGTAATRNVGTSVGQVISSSNASLMGAIASARYAGYESGFWEIVLPYKHDAEIMFAFQIKEYSDYRLTNIDVSGYLWANTDNWSRPAYTTSGVATPTVRFGKNAEGYAVLVIDTGANSGIGIYNAVSGFYTNSANLHGTTITRHTILPDHEYIDSTRILTTTSSNIRQTTGSSTNFPMSQKATTDLLATKANTSTQVIAGTGLTGGGNLTASRTLNVSYGTTAGTSVQGNDSRVVNAASNSTVNAKEAALEAKKADKVISITAGTGLAGGGTLAANRSLSVIYGTTAGTATQGNDSRVVNALQSGNNLSDITNTTTARSNLGLGTVATADLTTSSIDGTSGRVLKVGDGGWMRRAWRQSEPLGYPTSDNDVTNQTKAFGSNVADNGVSMYAAGIHFAVTDTWGRLRVDYIGPNAWIQGGRAAVGTGWTSRVILASNLQNSTGASTTYPMSQKAVSDQLLGVGQWWRDLRYSREWNVTYTNTTGRSICVAIVIDETGAGTGEFEVNGVRVGFANISTDKPPSTHFPLFAIVPPGSTYRATRTGSQGLSNWAELR